MLGRLRATKEITNKMSEQTHVNVEEPVQVTTENPKKVAQGKRLAKRKAGPRG